MKKNLPSMFTDREALKDTFLSILFGIVAFLGAIILIGKLWGFAAAIITFVVFVALASVFTAVFSIIKSLATIKFLFGKDDTDEKETTK